MTGADRGSDRRRKMFLSEGPALVLCTGSRLQGHLARYAELKGAAGDVPKDTEPDASMRIEESLRDGLSYNDTI